MPAGAAGDDFHVAESLELFLADVHLVEKHFPRFLRDAAEKRVANGARLFENFLLHEMLKAALFGHDRVPGDVLRLAMDRTAFEIGDLDALWCDHRDLTVAQEENAARVRQDRRNVAGDEEFLVAEAQNDRRAQARGHDFVRVFRRQRH